MPMPVHSCACLALYGCEATLTVERWLDLVTPYAAGALRIE
jgi:hypothetical protein